jgi:RNA polymerase sigma-70 factor (ECF subfamily)
MTDPDLELMEAVGRGDPKAFEALVERWQGPLIHFIARYLGDQGTAEDVAQEVFLRIYRAAPRFEARAKVSNWIFRIAYNRAMSELGRRKRLRGLYEALKQKADEEGEPLGDDSGRRDMEEELSTGLAMLPERQRAALLLRVNEELSYREIGEILGVSEQSVESLLFRARTNIKRHLGRSSEGPRS